MISFEYFLLEQRDFRSWTNNDFDLRFPYIQYTLYDISMLLTGREGISGKDTTNHKLDVDDLVKSVDICGRIVHVGRRERVRIMSAEGSK